MTVRKKACKCPRGFYLGHGRGKTLCFKDNWRVPSGPLKGVRVRKVQPAKCGKSK